MECPDQIDLPFFAYGIFQPGQLGFLGIRDFVVEVKDSCQIKGTLRIRDGLPIIDPQGTAQVSGSILVFKPEASEEAYKRIIEIKPDKHYRWDKSLAQDVSVNVLFGRSPQKGSIEVEDASWDGENDPLFTSALEVIKETLETGSEFQWDLKPLFRLQMAYLLLWSSIERYVSLRYHLGDEVTKKINNLANEPAFIQALKDNVSNSRSIFRADRPEDKVTLDPMNSKGSLEYYYQIRSNITHRGKTVVKDHEILRDSLSELLNIFQSVLKAAFEAAQYA
jgi:hypothetical protein